jgi:Protein of unknown function (DUF2938)
MRVLEILFLGVVATAAADLWQQALARYCDRPAPDWGKVGRWVAWLGRGVLTHRSIAATPPVRGEVVIGWVFHYVIGIVYAGLFLTGLRYVGMSASVTPALLFAAVTLLAPWFVLQPGLGLGVLARHAPNREAVRFVTISTHAVFGIGLALGVDLWRIVRAAELEALYG